MDAFGADRDYDVLVLQDAFDGEKTLAGQEQAVLVEEIGADDGVGDSGFIFEADENESFGGAGALAGDDAASDAKAFAGGQIAEFDGAPDAHGIEPLAAVGHGVRADGESGAVEVGDEAFFVVHGLQRGGSVGLAGLLEQRAGAADGSFDLPEGVAAVEG